MTKLVKKIVDGEHISPVLPDEIKNYMLGSRDNKNPKLYFSNHAYHQR